MNQTRFYLVENRNPTVQVNLLIGGLPLQKTRDDYIQLIQTHLAVKSQYCSSAPPAGTQAGRRRSPLQDPSSNLLSVSVSAGHLVAVSQMYDSQGEAVVKETTQLPVCDSPGNFPASEKNEMSERTQAFWIV